MEKFITHTGTGVPLRVTNVDTDQIIPARYLKSVKRTGFSEGRFLIGVPKKASCLTKSNLKMGRCFLQEETLAPVPPGSMQYGR